MRKITYKLKEYYFEDNIELDAQMTLAAMRGGIHGYMNAAFLRKDEFPTTDTAMARAEWLKRSGRKYQQSVADRVVELEKE